MTTSNLSSVSVRVGFAALLSVLAGCATAPAETAKQPAAAAPAFKPEVSINQVMVSVIDHNSHFLWDVADKTKAPITDRDWHELEHAAVTLVASGTMIMMGGTGPSDNEWSKQPEWVKFTQDQTRAANEAVQAVRAKSTSALLAAGDNIVAACEACHLKYQPDVPRIKATHH